MSTCFSPSTLGLFALPEILLILLLFFNFSADLLLLISNHILYDSVHTLCLNFYFFKANVFEAFNKNTFFQLFY